MLDPRVGGRSQELNDPQNRRRTLYGTVTRRDLNDMLRLDDPGPVPADAVMPQMRYRAAVAHAALPETLIDTDDWCVPDKRTWRAYLDVKPELGVPSLILRSDRTHYSARYSEISERADLVLDVTQIARWAGCLGGETTVVPVEGARHDVFLSLPEVRKRAYEVLDDWLTRHPMRAD